MSLSHITYVESSVMLMKSVDGSVSMLSVVIVPVYAMMSTGDEVLVNNFNRYDLSLHQQPEETVMHNTNNPLLATTYLSKSC